MDASFKLWQKALEYKAEPIESSELLVTIKECIDSGFACEVWNLVSDEEYKEILDHIGWELFSILTSYVTDEKDESYKKEIDDIICKIVEVCNPKEVILGILENISNVKSIGGFLVLLRHLKKALLRQTRQQVKFLQMVCEQSILEIRKYSRYCAQHRPLQGPKDVSISEDAECESKDFKQIPASEFVTVCLEFIDPFDNQSNREDRRESTITTEQAKILSISLNFVVELFDNPLSRLISAKETDLSHTEENLLENFFKWSKYFVDFLTQEIFVVKSTSAGQVHAEEDEGLHASEAGMANILYLLLVQERSIHLFPFVLRPTFLVSSSLKLVPNLLKRDHEVSVEKGLTLLVNLLSRLEDSALRCFDMDYNSYESCLKCLMNIAVWCEKKEIRKMAAEQLISLIDKIDIRERFQIISSSLKNAEHGGVAGLLIQCMKDNILQALKNSNLETFLHSKKHLFDFLELAFLPVTDEKVDVIESVDRLLAALNLLRFLLIRSSNGTDMIALRQNLPFIEETFLKPTRLSIVQSRVNHNEYLKEKNENHFTKDLANSIDFTVTAPCGSQIKSPSDKKCLQMVKLGLSTLDVLESVLARVSEIMDSFSCSPNQNIDPLKKITAES